MPEIRRGSRSAITALPPPDLDTSADVTGPTATAAAAAHNNNIVSNTISEEQQHHHNETLEHSNSAPSRPRVSIAVDDHGAPLNSPISPPPSRPGLSPATSNRSRRPTLVHQDTPRKSLAYDRRPSQQAYYDSRAATQSEYSRRARTLEDYYAANPHLLPQLPFTWHHGWKRFRLMFLIFMIFVDACAVPIALYYGLKYAGNVEGWIIFAVVTTIWGGPTYLEFGVRSWRLTRQQRFYRPLGATGRWSFDLVNWASILTIATVTALFVIGSAPHIVWLRVLSMPGPAILYCLGGTVAILDLYHHMGWRAPFRISSTAKGEKVHPGAYYFIEDVVAVNAGGGRPYREALAARYRASPRFRQMLRRQSLFWSIPSLLLAVPLTVVAVIHAVPATAAYGICWALPFLWALLWAAISAVWGKKQLVQERLEWETDDGSGVVAKNVGEEGSAEGSAEVPV